MLLEPSRLRGELLLWYVHGYVRAHLYVHVKHIRITCEEFIPWEGQNVTVSFIYSPGKSSCMYLFLLQR